MIGGVHDIVTVRILPPAPTQVTRIAGTKLCGAIFDLLEPPTEGQWVFDDKRIVVQSLASDVHHTRGFIAASRRSRDNCQKRDEDYNEKHT